MIEGVEAISSARGSSAVGQMEKTRRTGAKRFAALALRADQHPASSTTVDQSASSLLAHEDTQKTCRLREKPVAFAKTQGFFMSQPVALGVNREWPLNNR
jgi:hypothetical protein